MSIKIDLTGKEFGSLTVIRIAVDEPGKKKKWLCRCSCGNECVVSASNLVSGHSKQCPQCGYKAMAKKVTSHGMTGTKLYGVWNTMKNRCSNPSVKSYRDYGGRGIKVCDEWLNADTFFKWAKATGYKDGMEIDRIDNNGDYTPKNCRWVTRTENANNKSINKVIEHEGMTKTLADWARYYGVNYKNLSRLLIRGYTMDEAIERLKTGERTHRGSKAWVRNRNK